MVLESYDPAPIAKEGWLGKLGGGAGGHRNWKDRFFVFSDHMYYYSGKKEFEKDPKSALGRINLTAYYVSRDDEAAFEFTIHAYPKVRVIGSRARAADDAAHSLNPIRAPPTAPPLRAFSR
jgi:hypothetical protein